MNTPELGIIEGRFGRPWSWDERKAVVRLLAPAGYRFYHYGPKADRHLRRDWRTPHPPGELAAIADFAAFCRQYGMRFGIALTPKDAHHPLDHETRRVLAARVGDYLAVGLDDLAILFDDLRGDIPGLAQMHADALHICGASAPSANLFFCPTYYSNDPLLDMVFGQRPPSYLTDLGRTLDRAVRVYWTGEEVCSREIGAAHLRQIGNVLQRPVCLWDNYPVNDGARMSRFLHLRGFTGRPAAIGQQLSGHAINPAVQPILSCIPALTLAASYAQGDDYCYGAAFLEAATAVLGAPFARMLHADIAALNDVGLERLGPRAKALVERYTAIDHPAAREIVNWLNGADLMTNDEVQTQ